jgi:hypothetical protein
MSDFRFSMSRIQKASQLPAPARVLELAQSLGLDLPDTLPGNVKLLPDFFKGMIGIHSDSKAHSQHSLFPRSE